MTKQRFLWAVLFIGTCVAAYFSGERVLFFSATVLIILPAASYAISFLALCGIGIKHAQPEAVTKGEEAAITAVLHNRTPLPFSAVEVILNADENAVRRTDDAPTILSLGAFARREMEIPFEVEFRGFYALGLRAIRVTDATGLFRLSRKLSGAQEILSLPQVAELADFSLASNLMTQASSRFDIRDEDYSTISDIRQYQPTDSIKRVHWKLTAKRNEWLVKIFQSNALNIVSIILDTTRMELPLREAYALEDALTENALAIAKFCLNRGMPVDFHTPQKTAAKTAAEFQAIYQTAAALRFAQDPAADPHAIISRELNNAASYLNAVILTSRLTAPLCERILNAANNGHYIALMYCPPETPDDESEELCKIIVESTVKLIRNYTGHY
ncbi:MAG: DUF58 domain-containing protein [Defluviitaleaceae bacterium]|nr:DUF58 domain-containing protein [Defluviitaleaceae bacterium]